MTGVLFIAILAFWVGYWRGRQRVEHDELQREIANLNATIVFVETFLAANAHFIPTAPSTIEWATVNDPRFWDVVPPKEHMH